MISIDSIRSGAHARILPPHFEHGSIRLSIRPTLLRLLSLQLRQINIALSANRRVSNLSRNCSSDQAGNNKSRSDFGDKPSGPEGV